LKKINVVVSCTNRKTRTVPKGLRLRSLKPGPIEKRSDQWLEKLESHSESPGVANALYSGDHWYVARGLVEDGKRSGLDVGVWVCSAGYGLIPISSEVKPYSSTFSRNNEDSIHRFSVSGAGDEPSQKWWSLLQEWEGPSPGQPRSIAELASEHPGTPMLISASPRYLLAISKDLQEARSAMHSSDQLSVFSAGTASMNGLDENLIPCSARLQSAFGGPRFSLNVRAARKTLTDYSAESPRAPELRKKFKALARRQPELRRYERTPMSDDQVRTYIRKELKRDPVQSRTALLRSLRDNDRACEQKRFSNLYRAIHEETFGAEA
jgi:hypothetical protein